MRIKTFSRLLIAIVLFTLAACGQKASNDNRYHSIRPGEVWLDINGNPIQAHGFQVFYEDKDKRNMVRDEWETTRDATYVFLPVTFDKNGRPTIEWRDEWCLEDYK